MGIPNKLADLNNHLFEQLERLNADDLKGEELQTEIGRSKAMSDIAKNIVENAKLSLDAVKFVNEYGLAKKDVPEYLMLESDKNV